MTWKPGTVCRLVLRAAGVAGTIVFSLPGGAVLADGQQLVDARVGGLPPGGHVGLGSPLAELQHVAQDGHHPPARTPQPRDRLDRLGHRVGVGVVRVVQDGQPVGALVELHAPLGAGRRGRGRETGLAGADGRGGVQERDRGLFRAALLHRPAPENRLPTVSMKFYPWALGPRVWGNGPSRCYRYGSVDI